MDAQLVAARLRTPEAWDRVSRLVEAFLSGRNRRTLEAYRKSLPSRTTLVLPPDHEFFRFLDEGAGSVGPGAGAAAAPE